MSLFHFLLGGYDIECPHCGSYLDIAWDTEHADASVGDHSGTCPKCGDHVDFECRISYNVL